MTSSQLTEWIAYAELEPFGTEVEDFRNGLVCSTVVNSTLMAHSDPKKTIKWYDPYEFMPNYLEKFEEKEEVEEKRQTMEEMKDVLKAIAGVK